MKLKKSISLLLVLALTLMSVAFTVSADGADTANLSLVADKDTTALKAGDTFTVAVNLDDIAAQEFRSAQVAIYFNPEVLEIVDESGVATDKATKAFIESDNFYDEDEEEGYGERVSYSIDNAAGLAMYAFGKHKDSSEESIACAEGTYTIVQIRFKAKTTGATGLQFAIQGESPDAFETFPAGYKVKLGDAEILATITDTTAAIRIGVATIEEVINPEEPVNVDVDTALEDVIAELPEQVSVEYDDETVADVDVTWACEDYDAEVPGEYTFIGTIAGTDLTASIIVNVNQVEITSVAEGTVNVPFNATAEQVEALLPATVLVTLENEAEVEVPVTWEYTYEAGVTTGEVAATGTLDPGTKYLNTAEKTAAYTLVVSAAIETETEGTVETVVEDTEVAYEEEATKEDVIASLPKTVEIAVEGGSVTAFINWECEDFDAAKAGEYTFVGTIVAPENVTLASDTIEITVTVEEALEKEVVDVVTALEDQTTKTSSTLKLVSLFPETIDVIYQDGTTGTEEIVWSEETQALNAKKVGTYTLNGTVGENAYAISVKVTVEKIAAEIQPPETTDTVYIYLNNKIVNDTIQTMFTGQICQLQASETVKWSSTNNSIGMVTSDGKLVANNPGTVTIIATGATSVAAFDVRIALNPGTIASLGDKDDIEALEIPFTDLADYSWAVRMICELADKDIVSGKTDTLFAPGDNVTRAEYASLLVRAMKLNANGAGKEFTDVAQGEWYYNAVQTASALGIVSGYEDGSFCPNKSITREEMAVMTLRATEAAGRNISAKTTVSFNDADQISGFAKDAVNKLANAQIINGMGDNNFAPQQTANRAQAAVIIYQLCEL